MNDTPIENDKDKRYKNFLQEQAKLLFNAKLEGAKQLDTAILTLAGGAFGLSLLFLQHFPNNKLISCHCLLITSWVFFALSIATTMVSFYYSQEVCNEHIEKIQNYLFQGEEINNISKYSNRIDFLNYFSTIFFFIGFILIIIFGGINL